MNQQDELNRIIGAFARAAVVSELLLEDRIQEDSAQSGKPIDQVKLEWEERIKERRKEKFPPIDLQQPD